MPRFLVLVLLTAMTTLGTQVSSPSSTSGSTQPVTFNKDVLPILQNNCQVCHRPGEVAPMSFLTYESTRPWAKAIRAAVLSRKMPPWFADPHYGGFRNAPKLNQADINTLAAWADSGAREGDPADKPSNVQWTEGWRIQPDVVISMTEPYHIQAKGKGEIKEFFIPSPFAEDTWVSSIEVRPGDPSVVHHVIVQVPEQTATRGFAWGALNCNDCAAIGLKTAILTTDGRDADDPRPPQGGGAGGYFGGGQSRLNGIGAFTTMEAVYAPGSQPLD